MNEQEREDCGEDAPEFARIVRIAEAACAEAGGVKLAATPAPAPEADPCLVLWKAMNQAGKVGNRTDDKLIVKFLRDAGYCIAATPAPAPDAERQALRYAQAEAVMPLIGPLLDAWENVTFSALGDAPELAKCLSEINKAMEGAEAPPAPEADELATAHEARRYAQSEVAYLKARLSGARLILMREMKEQGWTPPAPAQAQQAAEVPDDPCLVLWKAMNQAGKVGNRTDDKLIVKFLRDAGYRIAPAPAPEAVKRYAICHETEQICSACPTRSVACEAATPAQAQQAAEPYGYLRQTSSAANPPHGWAFHFAGKPGDVAVYLEAKAKPEAQQAKPAPCPHIGQCHPGLCPCHGIGEASK